MARWRLLASWLLAVLVALLQWVPVEADVTCSPRPRVVISVAGVWPDALQVTVAAGEGVIQEIQFGRAVNALIDVPGGPAGSTGSFSVRPGIAQFAFSVRSGDRKASTTVPLTVTDGCGPWQTFVGGGTGQWAASPFPTGQWTSAGPDGGPVTALAIAPSDPRVVYAGTWGGGVFKSSDGARSWVRASEGLIDRQVSTLAVDPRDPNAVLVGLTSGLYRTANGGGSWSNAGSGLNNADVLGITFDPRSPTTIYAATITGIFRSIDGAGHWTASGDGLPISVTPPVSTASGVAIDVTTGYLYVGISQTLPPPATHGLGLTSRQFTESMEREAEEW